LVISLNSLAQRSPEESSSVSAISLELSQWDDVRGPWLAKSIEALSKNEPTPDRNFPENFTPHQMMKLVPAASRNRLMSMSRQNLNNDRVFHQLRIVVSSVSCARVRGRSYGDPHLVSFDGARYSFQTVGEFVMTKSNDSQMEVQTRQRPQRQDFSLNTAVAMNVAGDRVCIYASDYPDGDYSTPLRLNGSPVRMTGRTYYLSHGGTIKKEGNRYTVHWPTGEKLNAEIRRSGNMDFLNLAVEVMPCSRFGYDGLMGNANGSEYDDYRGSHFSRGIPNDPFGNQRYGSKERQAYIARQFADQYRITQFNSLFDYRPGATTETYTDRSFPRVFHDMDDLNPRTLARSRRNCEQIGISGRDLQGCIYDNAYLGIEPAAEPIFNEPTDGVELRPVTKPILNDNYGSRPMPSRPTPGDAEIQLSKEEARPSTNGPGESEQLDKGDKLTPNNERESTSDRPVTTRPSVAAPTKPQSVSKPESRPSRPVVQPRPAPRPKPAPRPVVKPRPISKPSAPKAKPRPAPRPKPVPRPSAPTKGRG
jgi:hypothetical protein